MSFAYHLTDICFRLSQGHTGVYLGLQLTTCLKELGIEKKVRLMHTVDIMSLTIALDPWLDCRQCFKQRHYGLRA